MNKSESIKELASALCKFQGEVEKIKKSETNPFFSSKYADLSSILDVIRVPLSSNGLSFVQFPKGENELETMIMHTSGEWMSETYQMSPVKKPVKEFEKYDERGKGVGTCRVVAYESDPQSLGSAITYQRRYALGAVLGLNIDVDDDGNKNSAPKENKIPSAPVLLPWNKKGIDFVANWMIKDPNNTIAGVKAKYLLTPEDEKELMDKVKEIKAKMIEDNTKP